MTSYISEEYYAPFSTLSLMATCDADPQVEWETKQYKSQSTLSADQKSQFYQRKINPDAERQQKPQAIQRLKNADVVRQEIPQAIPRPRLSPEEIIAQPETRNNKMKTGRNSGSIQFNNPPKLPQNQWTIPRAFSMYVDPTSFYNSKLQPSSENGDNVTWKYIEELARGEGDVRDIEYPVKGSESRVKTQEAADECSAEHNMSPSSFLKGTRKPSFQPPVQLYSLQEATIPRMTSETKPSGSQPKKQSPSEERKGETGRREGRAASKMQSPIQEARNQEASHTDGRTGSYSDDDCGPSSSSSSSELNDLFEKQTRDDRNTNQTPPPPPSHHSGSGRSSKASSRSSTPQVHQNPVQSTSGQSNTSKSRGHKSPAPSTAGQSNTQGSSKTGGVIVINNDHTLRRVHTKNELSDLIHATQGSELPALPKDIQDQMDKFKKIPVDQILHYAETGGYLAECLNDKRMCDVKFCLNGKEFYAHRVVLACYSPIFAGLVRQYEKLATKPYSEFRIRGINEMALKIFLHFMYTGQLKVKMELIPDILKLAKHFDVAVIKKKCLHYVTNLPNEQMLTLLRNLHDVELTYQILNCVAANFMDMKDCKAFKLLDVDTICMILSCESLMMSSEIDAFDAAAKWINHDPKARSVHLDRVMDCILFTQMTQNELFDCPRMCPAMKTSRFCLDLIRDANWVITSRMLRRADPLQLTTSLRRSSTSTQGSGKASPTYYKKKSTVSLKVEVVKSRETSPVNVNAHALPRQKSPPYRSEMERNSRNPPVSEYEKPKDTYCSGAGDAEMKNMLFPDPRMHHSLIMLDGKMYMIGGIKDGKNNKGIPRNDTLVFDPATAQWKTLSPMGTARMYHSLCVLDGQIYAIGGQGEGNSVLNSVECYDPSADCWFYVKSMTSARVGASAAALGGDLFVAGGYGEPVNNSSGLPVLNSVECYNPKTNKWERKSDLRTGRCHANLVSGGNKLYLFGGMELDYTCNESCLTSVNSVDVYDPHFDVWEQKGEMRSPRHLAANLVVGDRIYIIGGVTSRSGEVLTDVECLDVSRNAWVSMMRLPREVGWIKSVSRNIRYNESQ